MWPSRWFTATKGRSRANATALAPFSPMRSEPARPGPFVAAMTSISSQPTSACSIASRITGTRAWTWARDASSGTTPPYGRCRAIWLATALPSTQRPSRTTAAAVSSHELSIANTRVIELLPQGLAQLYQDHLLWRQDAQLLIGDVDVQADGVAQQLRRKHVLTHVLAVGCELHDPRQARLQH